MTVKRLLVIDDEVDFAKFVERVAKTLGYEVETTATGYDFMEACGRFDPHVIVMDISMPVVDGIELVRWLSGAKSRARIIIVSGFDPRYSEMAKTLGMYHGDLSITVLSKPVTLAELRDAIDFKEPGTA